METPFLAVINMFKQIRPADKLGHAAHPEFLEYFNQLLIPCMIEIDDPLRCPLFIKKVGKLRVG